MADELTWKCSETRDRISTNNNLSIKEEQSRDHKIPLINKKRKLTLKHYEILWKFSEKPSTGNVILPTDNEISSIYNKVDSTQNEISLEK